MRDGKKVLPSYISRWTVYRGEEVVENDQVDEAPRPWRVFPMPIHGYEIRDANDRSIVRDIYTAEVARLITDAANSFAAFEAMREALKAMLYMFDRELPAPSVGRRTCDEARAALVLADEALKGK